MIRLILCVVGITCVFPAPQYRDLIPNGYAVFNPCGANFWEAVGHYNDVHHTIDKNPFGKDFAAAGRMWTVDLCQKDSDGDGKTNGEELGDPNCTWVAGSTPSGKSTGQPGVSTLPYYRDAIPNGYAVFNPCGSSFWEAVGHYDPDHHTTEKNPFALAFAAAGHVWTPDLCRADSDGDGKSNGEELGDPNCVWTVGATPERSSTGQPGICEPIGSGPCASKAFTCGCHGQACVG